MIRRWLALLLVLGLSSLVSAQERVVERRVSGPADKNIRLGVYVNVKRDCTSGPLPTIRLVTRPAHGKVVVRKRKISTTNYKQCLALSVPAYLAHYRSVPGYSGNDSLVLEIRFPSGRVVVQKITVKIAGLDQTL